MTKHAGRGYEYGPDGMTHHWLFRPRVKGWGGQHHYDDDDRWYEGSLNGSITVDGGRGDGALDRWADDWDPYHAPTRQYVHGEWEHLAEVDPSLGLEDEEVAEAA